MKEKHFVAILVFSSNKKEILLLLRNPDKKISPNHYSGIGGHVDDLSIELIAELKREWNEETTPPVLKKQGIQEKPAIPWQELQNVTHWLTQKVVRDDTLFVMHWFVGYLENMRLFECDEGKMEIHPANNLPLPLTKPAKAAIDYMIRCNHQPPQNPIVFEFSDIDGKMTQPISEMEREC